MTSAPKITGNPYVGPRTFLREQGRVFFGREREARDLSARVLSERLLMFYAQSGAGKSSLINTRLIPNLQKADFGVLPVARVSGDLPPTVASADNIFLFNLMTSLLDQRVGDPNRFARLSLADFLAGLTSEDGATFDYHPEAAQQPEQPASTAPYVLILDQFEEIITGHPGRWQEREEFFRQLNTALQNDPSLWVLLTLREDYVAALDPYKPLLFNRLHATFFMQRMEEAAALEAVRKPAELGGRSFAPGVAEKLVEDLLQVRAPGQESTIKGQYVEPVQLQVVCYQLWRTVTANAPHWQASDMGKKPVYLTLEDLQVAGDVNEALERFYDDTIADTVEKIKEIPAAAGLGARQLRAWFEEELITDVGTRNLIRQGDAMTGSLPNALVRELQRRFLVRVENRSGDAWVELIHDRFVGPIRDSNLHWREQRRREQPWIDAAYGWHESGESPETRNAGLLLADLNLKTVLADTAGQQFEPVITEYLAASREAQEKRDQEAALGALKLQAEEAGKRADLEAQAAEALRLQAEAETRRADLEATTATALRRQRLRLIALAGGVFALLLLVGVLAINLNTKANKLKTEKSTLEEKTKELWDTKGELEIKNSLLQDEKKRAEEEADRAEEEAARADLEAARANAAQKELESVTLARIVSRLDLEASEDHRVFALLLSQQAMAMTPTLEAYGASIRALDAAYRHRDGWQPGVTPTLAFSDATELPLAAPLTLTVSADGAAIAAVTGGQLVVAQAADSATWSTATITTPLSRIDALAIDAGRSLVALGGCQKLPSAPPPENKPGQPSGAPNQSPPACDWRIVVLSLAGEGGVRRNLKSEHGIAALSFHPYLSGLLSATDDGDLVLWNLSASEPTPIRLNVGAVDDIVDLSVSADGRYVAAMDSKGRSRIWSWGDWTLISDDWPTQLRDEPYQDISFVNSGRWLAASADCPKDDDQAAPACSEVMLWDRETRIPLGLPIWVSGAIGDLGFDESTAHLWTAAAHRLVRWNLDAEEWPRLFCQRAGRNLTYDEWREANPGADPSDYDTTCREYEQHPTVVQARIEQAVLDLDDCAPQGRQAGYDQLAFLDGIDGPPRLATAVSALVGAALTRLESDPSDVDNQALAAACLEQANVLLADAGKPAIPVDEAATTAFRLLEAEQWLARDPQVAFGGLVSVQQSLDQLSVDLDDRLAGDYLVLCGEQGIDAACAAWDELGAPSRIELGEAVTARLAQSPGTPWYLSGKRGQGITVAMDALSSSFDPMVRLEGPDGTTIAENDDSGGTRNARIDSVLPQDGLYRVVPLAFSGGGDYRLTVEVHDFPTLAFGEPAKSTGAGETSWLFNGSAGQIVALALETDDRSSESKLTLTRPGEESWWYHEAYASADDPAARLRPTVLPDDDLYLVRVDLPAAASYTLTLDLLQPQALSITGVSTTVTSTTATDELWSYFGTAGQVVDLTLESADPDRYQPELALLDAQGGLSTPSERQGASAVIRQYITPRTGTLYVHAGPGDNATPYTLTVSLPALTPLEDGVPVEATLAESGLWPFDGEAGQLVRLSARSSADSAPGLLLLSDQGVALSWGQAGVEAGTAEVAGYVLPDSGRYYVRVDGLADDVPYELQVDRLDPEVLSAGQTPVASSGGERFWALDGAAGQIISLEVRSEDEFLQPSFALLSRRGDEGYSEMSETRAATASLPGYLIPRTGRYYLRVDGLSAGAPYQVLLSTVTPADLTLGEVVTSTMDGATFWAFDGAPGQVVSFALDAATDSGLDPVVRVFRSDGTEVAFDDDGGGGLNSDLTLVLPDRARYLVQADSYGGRGAFTLSTAELLPQVLPLDGSSQDIAAGRAWTLAGRAGQLLTAAITDDGNGSYPTLQLVTAEGTTLASSDGMLRLEALLPADGGYRLLAQYVSDSGRDSMQVTWGEAPSAASRDSAASQTLSTLVAGDAIDQALSLYRWGMEHGPLHFSAEARNNLCWRGALRGAVGEVIGVCEGLLDSDATSDPFVLAMRHDSRGLARALAGNTEGAIADLEYFVGHWSDPGQVDQRRGWIDRLRAGDPVSEIFDAATLEELLRQ